MKDLQSKFVGVDPHRCEACWQCVEACPKQVIGKINLWVHKHVYIKHPDACIGCKKCIRVCPHDAIRERSTSAHNETEINHDLCASRAQNRTSSSYAEAKPEIG